MTLGLPILAGMNMLATYVGPGRLVLPGRPFTRREALGWGLRDADLAAGVASGTLQHPMRGVYYGAHLEEDLALRIACLKCVVPEDAVVTDRTAAWLLGAPRVLAPGDHLVVPKVSVFRRPGYRLRNGLTRSGERSFGPDDVMSIDGIKVTTPLRTALDVGRLLHRDQALGVMDALQRQHGFTNDELILGADRFRRARGVVQLRDLAPHVDGRSGSPAESATRSKWLRIPSVPKPDLQIEVASPFGSYFLDLGVPHLKYAVEYDGEDFHGEEDEPHDRQRRAWIRRRHGWIIDVVRKENLFGVHGDVEGIIISGIEAARRRLR